jgi:hypothetical protein
MQDEDIELLILKMESNLIFKGYNKYFEPYDVEIVEIVRGMSNLEVLEQDKVKKQVTKNV